MSVTTLETICDVVFAHGARDQGVARFVRQVLSNSSLGAFSVDTINGGDELIGDVRRALAECSAVVLLLTRSTLNSQNTAFEVGMALAWNKPIYVLFDGIDTEEIPAYLRDFRVRPLSDVEIVVQEIAEGRHALSDSARTELVEVYRELAVPTDQLLARPLELKELADRFRERTGSSIGGERLAQELIRLRKQSKLPRLRQE